MVYLIRRALPFLLITAAVMAAGIAANRTEQERITKLEYRLIAPCCYAEPVATHTSEVALKMRAEITAWVSQGKTDREILDTYIKLYGLRVLAEPEGAKWWWATLVPCAAFLVAAVLAVLILRSWRRASHLLAEPPGTGERA